jgi:outer membrane protein TolC
MPLSRFLFVLFCSTPVWLCAQDILSLSYALSVGLKNNFDVQAERLNIDIAENNNNWGEAGRYPMITFNPNFNNSIIQRKPANPFAVAGRNISDAIQGQLDVQFVLFDGFRINVTKQRLHQLEKLSYGNAAVVIEQVVQGIILAYYAVLLERERLDVLVTNLELSRERYQYVVLRKQLGGAITFDVLQEENNLLTDSANVLSQEIVLRNSIRNLNLLLNEPNLNKTYRFIDRLEKQMEEYAYEDLKAKMLRSNFVLQNQFINQEIIRNNRQLAQAAQSPQILLNVGTQGSLDRLNANFRAFTGNVVENQVGFVNRDPTQPVFNNISETAFLPLTQFGHSYGAYANFGLRLTLSNGGQLRRATENARIQERIVQVNIDQLKLSLENDLLVAYDFYNLRRQLVLIAERQLDAAELNLRLADERYRNGALSAIDLRIVQENYRNAALANFQAIFNNIASRVELIRLTGGLVDQEQIKP